tara:strand:+ start:2009 stop:2320 length:312 start_codon:yes stop_codon:yes gene_type:complete
MKKILLILLFAPLLGFNQEIKSKIALAGDELSMYHRKQFISNSMIFGGIGLVALSTIIKNKQPVLFLGGTIATCGVFINIDSLFSLKKASKHLKNHKQPFLKY